jgi:serine/threonine protein phosphatase PrpC
MSDPTPQPPERAEAERAEAVGGQDLAAGGYCPSCGASVLAGDRFCEACGGELPVSTGETAVAGTAPPGSGRCSACGGVTSADGYCEQCGLKQPDPHDHEEIDLGWAAGITDRGRRHATNEDAMALATPRPGMAVVVVCDGVSSSSNARLAAQEAVATAAAGLLDGAGGDAAAALAEAANSAQEAVGAIPRLPHGEPPSCTFVAAVVHDGQVTVGWVGDSRAYWLGSGGNTRLTTDDSWAAEQSASGALTEEAAEADPRAHGITRWLGADATDTIPRIESFRPAGPGLLLVCSDGLWNYASSPESLASLCAAAAPEATPLMIARHLTEIALEAGGQDNITVAVVAL